MIKTSSAIPHCLLYWEGPLLRCAVFCLLLGLALVLHPSSFSFMLLLSFYVLFFLFFCNFAPPGAPTLSRLLITPPVVCSVAPSASKPPSKEKSPASAPAPPAGMNENQGIRDLVEVQGTRQYFAIFFCGFSNIIIEYLIMSLLRNAM